MGSSHSLALRASVRGIPGCPQGILSDRRHAQEKKPRWLQPTQGARFTRGTFGNELVEDYAVWRLAVAWRGTSLRGPRMSLGNPPWPAGSGWAGKDALETTGSIESPLREYAYLSKLLRNPRHARDRHGAGFSITKLGPQEVGGHEL